MNKLEKRLAALKAKHEEETRKLEAELLEQQRKEQSDGRFQIPNFLCHSVTKLSLEPSQSQTLSQRSGLAARPTTSRERPVTKDSNGNRGRPDGPETLSDRDSLPKVDFYRKRPVADDSSEDGPSCPPSSS